MALHPEEDGRGGQGRRRSGRLGEGGAIIKTNMRSCSYQRATTTNVTRCRGGRAALADGATSWGGRKRRIRTTTSGWLAKERGEMIITSCSLFEWRRHGETAAERRRRWPMALHLRARQLLPGLTCVRARVDVDRLMTAGDAAERRWTRGPWRGGWFGGAGYTAAGTTRPARTPGLIVVVVVVLVLVRILRDDGWPLAARCGRRVIHEF